MDTKLMKFLPYPAPQLEKSLLVWKVKAVRPATTAHVKKKACKTTDTS